VRRHTCAWIVLGVLAGGLACGSDHAGPPPLDAGALRDGGELPDGSAGVEDGGGLPGDAAAPDAGVTAPDGGSPVDAGSPPVDAGGPLADGGIPTSCDFDYDRTFHYARMAERPAPSPAPWEEQLPDLEFPRPQAIVHAEPEPPGLTRVRIADPDERGSGGVPYIVLPTYTDNMPLFDRGKAWDTAQRCYETPRGVKMLSEAEAYALYRSIAELTTGVPMVETAGRRNVIGLRGAYPGRLTFHGNRPDRFNDTLVLLWIDTAGLRHVREFPVNTDTGAHDFGTDASSSLRPNRRYRYKNGWHRGYNALQVDESGYGVRDDTNHNGHWDSDRNGWLAPTDARDHDRTGAGHNIHMGSVDAPLGEAAVDRWSAGCQVIPGQANWQEFITHAWTREQDPVDYFLVDVRDIDHRVWGPCAPDGTHACPYPIESFPFTATGDTRNVSERRFDVYNCSPANESGPEVVYFFTVDRSGTVTASVDDVPGDEVDVDVHLLDADDSRACLARSNISLSQAVGPGRYFLIVDTYVSGGVEKSGPYRLTVRFE
jgi:hypothetical protein